MREQNNDPEKINSVYISNGNKYRVERRWNYMAVIVSCHIQYLGTNTKRNYRRYTDNLWVRGLNAEMSFNNFEFTMFEYILCRPCLYIIVLWRKQYATSENWM